VVLINQQLLVDSGRKLAFILLQESKHYSSAGFESLLGRRLNNISICQQISN
jgi:hypothetical protein